VALLSAFGLWFSHKSRFRQITRLPAIVRGCVKELKKSEKGSHSAAASMATALGGTVGIGSITGVGIALETGGAGSVFWMWITGLLGCMLKYAETAAAVAGRDCSASPPCGGAMYALRAAGKSRAAAFFAVTCVAASFGTGCLTQSGAIADAAAETGVDARLTGAIAAACVLAAIWGGRRAMVRAAEFAVPAAGLIYLLAVSAVIIAGAGELPRVFGEIFGSAFGIRQAAGGISGAAFTAAVRTGVTRGVFSSECGMGSSPIAHASNPSSKPGTQGDWGILEVYADIFVFSTLTALAMLCCGTCSAYEVFARLPFGIGGIIFTPLLAVFGCAAAVSWCFYSETCLEFLFHSAKAPKVLYRLCAAACVYLGAVADTRAVWNAADILNLLMALPNLYLLFIYRKEICLCFTRVSRPQKTAFRPG